MNTTKAARTRGEYQGRADAPEMMEAEILAVFGLLFASTLGLFLTL